MVVTSQNPLHAGAVIAVVCAAGDSAMLIVIAIDNC